MAQYFSGLRTNASPALVAFKHRILCFYRDGSGKKSAATNGLLTAEFVDGGFKSLGNTGHDVSAGVGAAVFRGELNLFARHAQGNQMFLLSSSSGDPATWRHAWLTTEFGWRPSASCLGEHAMCCVASGDGIRYTTLIHEKGWQRGGTGVSTHFWPPALVTFQDELHMYFRDPNGNGLFHSSSRDGLTWAKSSYIKVDSGSGAALAELKGKLYMFYRDPKGNGVLCARSDNGRLFEYAGNTTLECSEDPACVVVGDEILVVAKEKSDYKWPGYDLMWTIFRP